MIDGKIVTRLESYAFENCSTLQQLIIPNTVTYLGCDLIRNTAIKEITIPKSVIYWDYSSHNYHFHSCLSLEAIYVEEGHEDLYSKNGCLYSRNGFEGNMRTLMVIPSAFTEFEIPSDINGIDSYAFLEGNSLQKLIIPKSAPELNPYYFDHFFFLENFVVDKNNDRYATIDGVLYSKDLKTIECYPSGRLNSSYKIPDGVTSIGDGCFNTSWHLSEIIIPEGVETIGKSAFFDCGNLHEITLPSTIKKIDASVFQHLHLKHLICKAVNPPSLYDEYVFFGTYEKILVPSESVELYKKAEYWNIFANNIYPIE
jgi:hypothetical protein